MGSYKSICSVSNTEIENGDEIKMILLSKNDKSYNKREMTTLYSMKYHTPFLLPINGKYNDYGSIEFNKENPTLDFLSNKYKVTNQDIIDSLSDNYEPWYVTGYFFKKHKLKDFDSNTTVSEFLGLKTTEDKYEIEISDNEKLMFKLTNEKDGKEVKVEKYLNNEVIKSILVYTPFNNISKVFEEVAKEFNYYMNFSNEIQDFIKFSDNTSSMFVHSKVYKKMIEIGKKHEFIHKLEYSSIQKYGLLKLGFEYTRTSKNKYNLDQEEFLLNKKKFILNNMMSSILEDEDENSYMEYISLIKMLNDNNIKYNEDFLNMDSLEYSMNLIIENKGNDLYLKTNRDVGKNQILYNFSYFNSGCMNMNIDIFSDFIKFLLKDDNSKANLLLDFVYFNYAMNDLGISYQVKPTLGDDKESIYGILDILEVAKEIKGEKENFNREIEEYEEDDKHHLEVTSKYIDFLKVLDYSKVKFSTLNVYDDDWENKVENTTLIEKYRKIQELEKEIQEEIKTLS